MKITTNTPLLSSLTSLLDPNQRGQQQALQEQQDLRQQQDKKAEQTGQATRQGRIDANRDALRKLQEQLKADNLEKLKTELSQDDAGDAPGGNDVNLNLRESFGNSRQSPTARPGQLIDIRV